MHVIEWIENGEECLWRTPNLSEAIRLMNQLKAAGIKAKHVFWE